MKMSKEDFTRLEKAIGTVCEVGMYPSQYAEKNPLLTYKRIRWDYFNHACKVDWFLLSHLYKNHNDASIDTALKKIIKIDAR